MKILLTDFTKRKSFDVYNILLKSYSNVDIVLYTDVKIDRLGKRLYKNIFRGSAIFFGYDNPLTYGEIFDLACTDKLVFLPIEEKSVLQFMQENARGLLETKYFYLLPDMETFNTVRDKFLLSVWCEKRGVLVPKRIDLNDIENKLVREDVIVKPRVGSGSRGIKSYRVGERFEDGKFSDEYIIQEKLPNSKNVEGCFVFCKNGNIIKAYTHQRLRTYPRNGGVTVLSKQTMNLTIIREAEHLLKALKYSGLVMIEYLFDSRDDSYKLIEVNPRIWGSILLSEEFNFIGAYIKLACCEGSPYAKHNKGDGRYLSWVIPYGILNIFYYCGRGSNVSFVNFSHSSLKRSVAFIFYTYMIIFIKRLRR